jgi:hypothetical protein
MYNPSSISVNALISRVKSSLRNRFEKKWKDILFDDVFDPSQRNKLGTYWTFKNVFQFEPYLSNLKDSNKRKSLTRFTTSTHTLRIERGRYMKTPVSERICQNCNFQDIEDENHILFLFYMAEYIQAEACSRLQNVPLYGHCQFFQRAYSNPWGAYSRAASSRSALIQATQTQMPSLPARYASPG